MYYHMSKGSDITPCFFFYKDIFEKDTDLMKKLINYSLEKKHNLKRYLDNYQDFLVIDSPRTECSIANSLI
jgi:hypothetical protein